MTDTTTYSEELKAIIKRNKQYNKIINEQGVKEQVERLETCITAKVLTTSLNRKLLVRIGGKYVQGNHYTTILRLEKEETGIETLIFEGGHLPLETGDTIQAHIFLGKYAMKHKEEGTPQELWHENSLRKREFHDNGGLNLEGHVKQWKNDLWKNGLWLPRKLRSIETPHRIEKLRDGKVVANYVDNPHDYYWLTGMITDYLYPSQD